jgi:phosphoglycerol transferase MdoB-like AlkP superfamily enzyme
MDLKHDPNSKVRRTALLPAVGSGLLALAMVVFLQRWEASGGRPRRTLLLLAAMPTAYCFAQLAVLVTGVPFASLAKRWDSLSGIQRLAFALAILAIVVMAIGGIGVAILS